jgi:protein phosphatase
LKELAAAPEVTDKNVVAIGDQWYQVLPASEQEPEGEEQPVPGWRLEIGQASHPGQLRELDEDSVLTMTLSTIHEGRTALTLGLYAIADGIGGQDAGEVASRLALQTLARQVLQRVFWPELQGEPLLLETMAEQLSAAVQSAGQSVYDARLGLDSDMGTTLTAVLIRNDLALIANVGDSRTYVWGPDGLLQLTEDHSLVAKLIAAGEVAPEAIYTHPQRSLISRCLGDSPEVQVDLFTLILEPGYRLLLCCDGVWEMIRDEGIEEVLLRENHPQQAADMIVTWSNEAGGEDNISVIIVNVGQG